MPPLSRRPQDFGDPVGLGVRLEPEALALGVQPDLENLGHRSDSPVSLSGWGVREGTLAGMFALVGMAPADIVVVSILYGLTGPAIGVVYAALSGAGQACATEN